MRRFLRLAAATLALASCAIASAHQASDAYLRASTDAEGRLALQVDVALRDLEVVLELDADSDGQLTWGEVRRREKDIVGHIAAHLRLADGRCALTPQPGLTLDRKADGVYAVLRYQSDCAASTQPTLAYGLFRETDPTHRGLLVVVDAQGQPSGALRSLNPGGAPVKLALLAAGAADGAADATADPGGAGFFADGLHHILIGADHVLFLVCLLLPLALGKDTARSGWRQRLWPLLWLVTAFTLGHSITLGLASLRILSVPPSVIEPLIALTIAMTALDNIRPFLGRRRVLAAFAFGLIHGFGFAGPLVELDLAPLAMAWALLQFNLGVEAGQLVVVVIAAALLWPWHRHARAGTWMRAGSAVAGVVALLWFAERVLDFKLLPV